MTEDGAGPDLFPPNPELAPPPPPPPPAPPAQARPSRRQMISRRGATAAVATGLVAGGIAGGYIISQAASTAPAATASPSAGSGSPETTPDHPRGVPGANSAARTQDLQQVAGAIGITTAQLQSEMSAGKTIAAIATEHGVAPAKVISTLVSDENAEIDTAVRSGQLTTAQATQLKSGITQRVTDLVNGTEPAHGPGGPGWPGGPGGPRGEDQQVIATAIGISTTQLQTELTAGKTIAAIATEHKVTAAKVSSALVASENAEIDQRVSSGQMTAAQGAQLKTGTVQRVTAEVNGTESPGGFGRHDGAFPGAPSGMPPTAN
jgi:ribosomal protein L10